MTHGMTGTDEYRAWISMIQRCENVKNKAYKNYGGRGITVCERWRHDFSAFLQDVGKKPHWSLSLDRIDNNGNYEPGNVRWATQQEQVTNRRKTWPRCSICGQPGTYARSHPDHKQFKPKRRYIAPMWEWSNR